ncbi:MAG: RNA-binding protein [Candidatus Thermoplasmatota archaeon]|nr:RNA-binding protein [Candidatus Thermoplasmatota archaeon]
MRKHALRKKESTEIIEYLNSHSGTEIKGERIEIVDDRFLANGDIFAFFIDEKPYLTIKGAMQYNPTKKLVVVDAGAVRYVSNGADVMAPGIVEADMSIRAGEIVYIVDEKNRRVIAVGRALVDAEKILEGKKEERRGKVIKNIHWVGDKIWKATSSG